MYKFNINNEGYCSGYSKNGDIPMDDEFNLTNLPTPYHRHDGTVWVLDKDLQIESLTREVLETRAALYNIGDEVGAMIKQFKYMNMQNDLNLIQELDDVIAEVQIIKNNNPKPEGDK